MPSGRHRLLNNFLCTLGSSFMMRSMLIYDEANFQQIPWTQPLLFHPGGHNHALPTASESQPGEWAGARRGQEAENSSLGSYLSPECNNCLI